MGNFILGIISIIAPYIGGIIRFVLVIILVDKVVKCEKCLSQIDLKLQTMRENLYRQAKNELNSNYGIPTDEVIYEDTDSFKH